MTNTVYLMLFRGGTMEKKNKKKNRIEKMKFFLVVLLLFSISGGLMLWYNILEDKSYKTAYEIKRTLEDSKLENSYDSRDLVKSLKKKYNNLELDYVYDSADYSATFTGKYCTTPIEVKVFYRDKDGYKLNIPEVVRKQLKEKESGK